MNRVAAIAFGFVGTGLVLAAAALLVLPSLLQDEIEAQLRARLAERGVQAEWSAFESHWGKSFELRDLHLAAPAHGVELKSGRVVVSVPLDAIISGEPRLDEIELEPVSVTLDVDALLEADEKGASDAAPGGDRRAGLLRRVLADPPTVVLRDASLEIRRGPRGLASVESEEVIVSERWGTFRIDAQGRVRLKTEGLPEFLRPQIPWRFQGSLDPSDGGKFEYVLSSVQPERPLLDVADPEHAAIQLGAIRGDGRLTDRTTVLRVDDVDLRIGKAEQSALSARVPHVHVELQENGRIFVQAVDSEIVATPARAGAIRAALPWARSLISQGEAPTDDAAPAEPSSPGGLIARLGAVAARTDLSILRLRLDLQLADESGNFSTLTPLERLDARARNGLFRAHGETAGGSFFAEAEFLPGSMWPHYAIARVEDVELEKIPGMPKQRSQLPSRGTSGRLGGKVSASLVFSVPPLGAHGPLLQRPGFGVASLRWRDGLIDLTGVSEEPLDGIDTAGSAFVRWRPELGLIELTDASFEYGPIVVHADATLTDVPLDPEIELSARMEEIECQRAIRALPTALLGPYRAIELEGKVAPTMQLRLPIYRPRGLRLSFDEYQEKCTIEALNAYNVAWPEIRVVEPPPTGPHRTAGPIPEDRKPGRHDDVWWLNRGFVKRVTEGISEEAEVYVGPGTSTYVPLHEMPAYVGAAAFLSEQMMFYSDPAISVGLINKALRLNLEKGRFVYGGSTVTQQLVKNLFLSRDKTLARKLQEALVAWRVTQLISKDRVLELYLNCIEFGPDIYGIGPAARYYFDKDARELTALEAVFLAMLKPAPWYGKKVIQRKKTPTGGWWAGRMDELFGRLVDKGYLSAEQAEAEKPYVLEWDAQGRYVDRKAALELPRVPTLPLFGE